MPLGPKQSVNAILDVKGGEISGRSVTALIKKVSHFGSDRRVTAKAKMNPMIGAGKTYGAGQNNTVDYGADGHTNWRGTARGYQMSDDRRQ